jgi:hypothetical protein
MPFCPHCNRNTFEIIAVDAAGTKYNCVQCSGCKAPVCFVERARAEESDEAFETRVTEALRVVVSNFANNQISAHSHGADNANEAVKSNGEKSRRGFVSNELLSRPNRSATH